jgi:hypothetical protein
MQKSKLQLKIQNFTLFAVIFVFLFLLLNGSEANAAELFFEAKNREFTQGEEFLASIFLNSLEESINAAEGRVLFSENLLEVKEIRDGNSIINFWIERPRIEQAGAIGFSGIIPGGYQETKGLVFSVVFQAKANGSGAIEIQDAKVLLNDGEGTSASVKLSPFQFSISQEEPATPPMVETVKDTNPPEDFEPEIASDSNIFDGKYFLVFATQDKGSGIDHYEVCEGSKRKCMIAESPYLLQNQKLDQQIFVKAVDKSGNERAVMLPPQKPLPWYKNYFVLAILIIIGLMVIGVILRKILWQKFIKSR